MGHRREDLAGLTLVEILQRGCQRVWQAPAKAIDTIVPLRPVFLRFLSTTPLALRVAAIIGASTLPTRASNPSSIGSAAFHSSNCQEVYASIDIFSPHSRKPICNHPHSMDHDFRMRFGGTKPEHRSASSSARDGDGGTHRRCADLFRVPGTNLRSGHRRRSRARGRIYREMAVPARAGSTRR